MSFTYVTCARQRFPQDWRQGGNVSKVGGRPNFSIFPALHRVAPVCSYILHIKFMSYVCLVCVHVAGVSHGKAHIQTGIESKVCWNEILPPSGGENFEILHRKTRFLHSHHEDNTQWPRLWTFWLHMRQHISNMHGWIHCSASRTRRLFNNVI